MRIRIKQAEVHLPGTERALFIVPQLKIESGEKILITGESGRGKTTLLHLLAGLFLSHKGQVEIGDINLNSLNDEQRCTFRRENIAMIFQKLNLIDYLTAGENVMLQKPVPSARMTSALAAVGLGAVQTRRASSLSLGEQQRVAVARVLCADSKLILADEPTSSLDARNGAQVIDLLFKAAQGQTLIVVSHDQRLEAKFDRHLEFDKLVLA